MLRAWGAHPTERPLRFPQPIRNTLLIPGNKFTQQAENAMHFIDTHDALVVALYRLIGLYRAKYRWMSMATKTPSMTIPMMDSLVASHDCSVSRWNWAKKTRPCTAFRLICSASKACCTVSGVWP